MAAHAQGWAQSPCRLNTGELVGLGYVRVWWHGKRWLRHRLTWHQKRGPIPPDMKICHHCDTPACDEIMHLFMGTQQANCIDMVRKGRHGKAGTQGRNKGRMDRTDADRVREMVLYGAKQRDIACVWQVSPQYVNDMVRNRELTDVVQ